MCILDRTRLRPVGLLLSPNRFNLASAAPILFGLARHRRRGRVLDLDPMSDPAGTAGEPYAVLDFAGWAFCCPVRIQPDAKSIGTAATMIQSTTSIIFTLH